MWMVYSPSWISVDSLTSAFCFTCDERTDLAHGIFGYYSECEVCGEPTGIEHMVLKAVKKKMAEGEEE